jgi:hypothetical protein
VNNKYFDNELLINDLIEMYKYYFRCYCLYLKKAQEAQDDLHYRHHYGAGARIHNNCINPLTTILETYDVNIEAIQKEVKGN